MKLTCSQGFCSLPNCSCYVSAYIRCFADGVQPANCTPPCTTPTYPSTCYDVTAFRSRKTRDGEPARLGIFQSDGLEDVALLAVDTSDELALGGRGKGHLVLAFR